jgi:peptidoglycan/LPS O-acetylase OafA/YrhL
VWNCPAWSLSVETWFYLAFPLLIAVFGRWLLAAPARGAALLAAAMLASAAIFPAVEQRSVEWTLPVFSLSPLSRWPEFVAGIGLAALAARWRPATSTAGWATLAAGAVWVASAVFNRGAITAAGGHLLPIALPGFVLVILGAWGLRTFAAGLLGSPLLVLLGEASYALYLLHAPLHSYVLALTNRVVGRGFDTSWAVFAFYLPLALGLSVAVYHWVERPARTRLRAAFGLGRPLADGPRA